MKTEKGGGGRGGEGGERELLHTFFSLCIQGYLNFPGIPAEKGEYICRAAAQLKPLLLA